MLLTHILSEIAKQPTEWGEEKTYGVEVFGFDAKEALLLVPLHTDFGITTRTLLLKTTNGGTTWQLLTIMKGYPSIVHFLDQEHLWISTYWGLECPHVIALYKSTDFGDTWHINYSLKKFFDNHEHGCFNTVEYLRFASPKQGVAKLVFEWDDFPTYFLETVDGGATWQMIATGELPGEKQWEDKRQSFSLYEKNVWMYGESEDHIFILKKEDETWHLATQFPKKISKIKIKK